MLRVRLLIEDDETEQCRYAASHPLELTHDFAKQIVEMVDVVRDTLLIQIEHDFTRRIGRLR